MPKYTALGTIAIERDVQGVDLSDALIDEYAVELDKETGSTHPVVKGQIDMYELIQSYKGQCGMTAAMEMLKRGQASPEDFMDDGHHGVDCTFPVDLNTANYIAGLEKSKAQDLASKLEIDGYESMTDADLYQKIYAKLSGVESKVAEATQE